MKNAHDQMSIPEYKQVVQLYHKLKMMENGESYVNNGQNNHDYMVYYFWNQPDLFPVASFFNTGGARLSICNRPVVFS